MTFPERVPIRFNPASFAVLQRLEDDNNIPENQIAQARWIKLIQRRVPNQQAAFLILSLTNPSTANQIMKDGIAVEGLKLWCRKLMKEPWCCMKCHELGANHNAYNCPVEKETCGTCEEAHDAPMCTLSDCNSFFCVNCKVKGHASWTHTCPTMLKHVKSINTRELDNQYLYYLVEADPASRIMVDGTVDIDQSSYTTPSLPDHPQA